MRCFYHACTALTELVFFWDFNNVPEKTVVRGPGRVELTTTIYIINNA